MHNNMQVKAKANERQTNAESDSINLAILSPPFFEFCSVLITPCLFLQVLKMIKAGYTLQ